MKKLIAITISLLLCAPLHARGKNLHHLAEKKPLKVYIDSFLSKTDKIQPSVFQDILKNILSARKKETFLVTADKDSSDIIIDCDILNFIYLEKDPVDHIVGGTTGLIVDALVSQNYGKIEVEFSIFRSKDNKRLWHSKFVSSVTQSDMPEPDSIPKVLTECSKRFIFLCFGKPQR